METQEREGWLSETRSLPVQQQQWCSITDGDKMAAGAGGGEQEGSKKNRLSRNANQYY